MQFSSTTSLSQPVSPLTVADIPEIISQITFHLSKKDIASCALVCRNWYTTFTPNLWKSINARLPTPENAAVLPTLLAKHGNLIRNLTIKNLPEKYTKEIESIAELPYDCPPIQNVVTLDICPDSDMKGSARNIIARNKSTLRELKLEFQMGDSKPLPGWRGETWIRLSHPAPYLHTLTLENWRITRDELIELFKGCPGLKELTFNKIYIDQDPISTETKDSSANESEADHQVSTETFQHLGIKHFRMCSTVYQIMDLIPNIEILELHRFTKQVDPDELESFCQSIKDHCQRLNQILALGFECSMLPAIIDSTPQLKIFTGYNDIPTFNSMLTHAETLEEVNLLDYAHLPLLFLETCPKLRHFIPNDTSITVTDVQSSVRRGWECKELQELRLSITKLSTTMIEAIMQDLGAEKPDTVAKFLKNSKIWQIRHSEDLRARQLAIEAFTPEQRSIQKEFSGFLSGMSYLTRINFGTGWYTIPRPNDTVVPSKKVEGHW